MASAIFEALFNARKTFPKLPTAPIAPPATPTIFPTLVVKAPTAVMAGPMTGAKPMNPRVNLAIELSEVVAHSNV